MNFPGSNGGRLLAMDPGRLAARKMFDGAVLPQITSMFDVDMSKTVALRNATRQEFERQTGASLGYMPFFMRATAKALRAVPQLNAMMVPQGLWLHDRIMLGVPVDSPMGTIVPVILDPDRKSVAQLAVELHDKAQRGRVGQLRMDDFGMTTFSVSNPGTRGSIRDVPLVLSPHVGTLTFGKVEDRPVAVQGQVQVRPMMTMSLTFDHRALEGTHSTGFLTAVKNVLEQALFA